MNDEIPPEPTDLPIEHPLRQAWLLAFAPDDGGSEPGPYAGILRTGNGSFSSWTGSAPSSSWPPTIAAMKALLDEETARPARPTYDVTFRCEACGCAGIAVGPVSRCPKCDHEGILNADRGWNLPAIRFFDDGAHDG